MAHILEAPVTETGTKVITPERSVIEIYIDVNPAKTLSGRFYYADYNKEVITKAGADPVTNITSVNPIGSVELTGEELKNFQYFNELYVYLKTLANAKALIQWPELSDKPTA